MSQESISIHSESDHLGGTRRLRLSLTPEGGISPEGQDLGGSVFGDNCSDKQQRWPETIAALASGLGRRWDRTHLVPELAPLPTVRAKVSASGGVLRLERLEPDGGAGGDLSETSSPRSGA